MITQHSSTDQVMVQYDILKCKVISAYFPNEGDIGLNFEELMIGISETEDFIGCVDSNAYHVRWGSNLRKNRKWKAKIRGETLIDLIDQKGIQICNQPPHLPTFIRDSAVEHTSHIDITLSSYNLYNKIEKWVVKDETYMSDHRAIVFRLDSTEEEVVDSEGKQYGVPWKKPSKKMNNRMQIALKQKVKTKGQMNNIRDVDNYIERHTADIQQVVQKVFKKKVNKYNTVYWWTEAVQKKYKELRKARKRMRKYKYSNLKIEFYKIRKEFRKIAKEEKLKSWRTFMSGIQDPWEKLMKIVKATYIGKIQRRTLHDLEGIYAHNIEETLYMLGKQFFPPPSPKIDFHLEIERSVRNRLLFYEKGPIITHCELREAVKLMRNNSAPGFDQVTANIVKFLVNMHVHESNYLRMYNICLQNAHFPEVWKSAKVVLIPKPTTELNSVKAYRPISLTSTFSKLFERLILSRILHHLVTANVLTENQHAYTKGKSTITALYDLFDIVQHTLHNTGATKNICVVLFLDISGAFDRTWHEGILHKLLEYDVPKYLVAWVRAFLQNRKAVFMDNDVTYQMDLMQGCPHGGVLSPILWNILFNDLLALPTWSGRKIYNQLKVIGYADDAAIICRASTVQEASELINIHLSKISRWSDQYRVKFNPAKLAVLTLSNKNEPSPPAQIYYENILIKEVTEYKYLGLIVDTKCTWKPQINGVLEKLTLVTRSLFGLSRSNWGVNLEIFRLIFHAVFMPVMTYGISIWGWRAAHKGTCARFDKQIRNFGLLATKCLKSTSSTYIFGLLRTQNFARVLEYEALKTSIQQFHVMQTARKSVYDNYCSKRKTREVPQSMDHHYYMSRKSVSENLQHIEFHDENQHLRVHPSKWVTTKIAVDDKTTAILKGASRLGWVLYTDASKCTFGMGWVFVVFRSGFFVHRDMGALTECSVFNAEAYALYQAVQHVRFLDTQKREVVEIRSDSLALVRALEKEQQSNELLGKIKQALRQADKKCQIVLRWVPSHQGMEGNELADQYAKKATDAKIETRIMVSKKEINLFLKRKRKAEMRNDWEQFQSRNVKFFLPDIDAVQKFIKASPSAPLCQIVSGHTRLNDFVCNKLGLIASSQCKCGKGKETIVHFLLECELYDELRKEIWIDFKADMQYVMNDWRLLNQFILKSERFNQNVREALLNDG